MEQIKLSNYKNNIDCVELWNYINEHRSTTVDELKLVFNNENWKENRVHNKKFCSNLLYCLKKLKTIGAIQMTNERNSDGEYDFSSIIILREPIIKYKSKRVCVYCNEENDKSYSSKYKNLCNKCTKKYMLGQIEIDLSLLYISNYKDKTKNKLAPRKPTSLCVYCFNDKGDKKYICDSISCIARRFVEINVVFLQGKNEIMKKIIGLSCCVCGYDKILNYHHIVYKENGGKDNLNNIMPLCPNHHSEVHYCGLDVSKQHKQLLQRLEDIKNGIIVIE